MVVLFGGIDIPIYETVFIIAVIFFACLVIMLLGIFYILKELKTLKELISKEEADIDKLEKFQGKKEEKEENNKEIKKYIKDSLGKGFKWDQIKQSLVKQGWDEKELDKIHKELE